MDSSKMIEAALGVVVKVLTEKVAVPTLSGVWDWMKRKLGPASEPVQAIEAKPDDILARAKLTLALSEALKDPAAAAELAALLQQAQAAGAITQTAIGNKGPVAQVAGDTNTVTQR